MNSHPSEPRLSAPGSRGAVRRRRALCGVAAVAAIALGLWWHRHGPGERAVGSGSPPPPVLAAVAGAAPSGPSPTLSAPPRGSPPAVPVPGAASAPAVGDGLAQPAPRGGGKPPYVLTATAADATTQSLTLTVADYTLAPAWGGYWAVTLGDTLPLAVRGAPALPFVRHEVLLAEGSAPELEIVAADWEERPCPPLLASPGFVSRAAAWAAADARGPADSVTAGFFPRAPVRLTPVYRWRGWPGVGVIFCPFRYDAAAGVLGVCRRLEVRVRGAAASAALAGLPESALVTAAQRWPTQAGALAKAAGDNVPQESLLVLVPDALVAAPTLAEFALWKRQRGVAVSVQSLTAAPSVSSVKALIRAFATGKERANVLILGDEAAIPPAQVSVPPSDTVYALLDGGADRYHDLSISRLTATSASDLALQLGRTVMYERWQWAAPSAGSWCAAATAVASNENQGNLGLLDREAMETVRTGLLGYGYSSCAALYDLPGVSPSKDDLTALWNSGRGLVLYLGHGFQQSWRTTGFAVADVNRLLRYGSALPFVVSAACHTGNFALSSESLCEALLRGGSAAAPTGAIGAIGATSTMDWDPPVVMLQSFTAYLTRQAQFASGGLTFAGGPPRTTAGELTFGAVQRAVDFCLATPDEGDAAARRIVEQTHLFGDPTLGVRTRVPAALRVSHGPAAFRGAPFGVTVQDAATGQALAGLIVCLYAADRVQWLSTTDAQGGASFAVPLEGVPDALTLTVYAPDVIPYQAEVAIPAAVAPVEVLTADLPAGRRAVPYTASLAARGGNGRNLEWSTSSALPAGLILGADGTLAGVPTDFGTWHLTVRVADDSVPPRSAEAELKLLIVSPVFLDLTELPEAESCQAYAAEIPAFGTWPPFTFSVPDAAGAGAAGPREFPAWLTLSPAGQLVGAALTPARTLVPIRVTDAAGYEVTVVLGLTVRSTPADLDGNADLDSLELLRYGTFAQSGCITAAEWAEALGRWEAGSQAEPGVPAGIWRGAAPRRVLGPAHYQPGGDETIRIDLGLTDPVPAGAMAILSEILPPGWLVADGSARDAAGRVLPGPRRDGSAVSWVLDEAALRGGTVSIGVRPAEAVLRPALFEGWIACTGGVVAMGGDSRWWPRRATRLALSLRPGWNLVSLPLALPAGAVPAALAALGLRHCDARGQIREVATAVAPFAAYWVYAPAAQEVDLLGFAQSRSVPVLAPGWNAFGVGQRLTAAALPGAPRLVWAWTATGWEAVHSDLQPGCGYLVFVQAGEQE